MLGDSSSTYDELPYESQTVAPCHIDRIAAMAALFGLDAPRVERSRVLELGCAQGDHLVAMAQTLPDAEFVGVEISKQQVAQGQTILDSLGYRNVALKAMSLTEVDESFGRFDYILCHGVYSWVPQEVQAKILEICTRNLAPNGVVFLSYNVYPGWHERGSVRAMMLYHTWAIAEPRARVQQARSFLEFLTHAAVPQGSPYALALRQELEVLKKCSDTYLFHEHLEPDNAPVYFHELIARASAAGLRYVGPSRFPLLEAGLKADIRAALAQWSADRIACEQYLDFVLNRAFRESLFCHAALDVRDTPAPEPIRALRITPFARPESTSLDVASDRPETFRSMFGDHITVSEPLVKAAVVALGRRWPRSAGCDELRAETLALLGRDGSEPDSEAFAGILLQAHRSHLVDLHTYDPPLATEPGDLPHASALARRQAAQGMGVVSLRNREIVLRELDRLVIPLLDGTRNAAAIVNELAQSVADGSLKLHRLGQTIQDPAEARTVLAEAVATSLQRAAAAGLLMSE